MGGEQGRTGAVCVWRQRQAMQGKVGGSRHGRTGEHGLELRSTLEVLHGQAALKTYVSASGASSGQSDSQALATFGATRIDDSAAATGFHADQKTVGTGATDLGRLVSASHDGILSASETLAPLHACSRWPMQLTSGFLLNRSGNRGLSQILSRLKQSSPNFSPG